MVQATGVGLCFTWGRALEDTSRPAHLSLAAAWPIVTARSSVPTAHIVQAGRAMLEKRQANDGGAPSHGHAGATDPAVASGWDVCVLGGIGGEARVARQPRFPVHSVGPGGRFHVFEEASTTVPSPHARGRVCGVAGRVLRSVRGMPSTLLFVYSPFQVLR